MTIATVITGGYGAFGSVALVITDGYSIGSVTVPTADGLQYRIRGMPFHMQAGGARTHYRAPGEPFHYQDDDP